MVKKIKFEMATRTWVKMLPYTKKEHNSQTMYAFKKIVMFFFYFSSLYKCSTPRNTRSYWSNRACCANNRFKPEHQQIEPIRMFWLSRSCAFVFHNESVKIRIRFHSLATQCVLSHTHTHAHSLPIFRCGSVHHNTHKQTSDCKSFAVHDSLRRSH